MHKVSDSDDAQLIVQVTGRIAIGPARRHRIPKHAPAILQSPVGCFMDVAAFDPATHGQQLRRRDLLEGSIAKPREDIALE